MNQTTKIKCIGFIMDGNRRWAKSQGLETFEGHKKGGEVLRDSISFVQEQQIPHAVYYAFSTENWQRSEEEVGYLMDLFREWIRKIEEEFVEDEKVQVKFIGRREDFSDDLIEQMNKREDRGSKEAETTIWIALAYGGRAEILETVNRDAGEGRAVTEESFNSLLWTAEMPDPDIVVRTGGEQRLSNCLPWSSVYSELYFMEKPWPALTTEDFTDILHEYEKRDRRTGK